MAENNKLKDLLVKTLFIVGIILVIVILAFAVIKVIPRLFSSFASVGDAVKSPFSDNALVIDINDENINSGETAFMTWDYEPSENGVYEIQYACTNYLEVQLGTSEGNKDLKCNTVYHLNPNTKSVSLLPIVTRENILVDMPVYVSFVNSDGKVLEKDDVSLTIKKQAQGDLAGSGSIINTEVINTGSVNNTNTGPANTSNTSSNTNTGSTGSSYTPIYSGYADLAVSNIIASANTVVSFTVSNIGGNPSGVWYFNYKMPDGDTELSPAQVSLRPGESIRYTLRFEDVPAGLVTISIDPYNAIYESNNFNNTISIRINGDGGYDYNDYGSVNYDRNDDADLYIRTIEVGRMSGSRFIEDDDIDDGDDAAVRFVVANKGGQSTGSWRFEITNTPYDDDDDYRSSRQSSMRPGESREIIVEFENVDEGIYNVKVEVDSDDDVDEERESNNDETERLRVRD